MSGGHAFHAAWAPEHPVRWRMIGRPHGWRYLSLDDAMERIEDYARRGAVPQPPDVRDQLLAGRVITTHISEFELLRSLPCPDCESDPCACPGAR